MSETKIVDSIVRTWDGRERRTKCTGGCQDIIALEERVTFCKERFDKDIQEVHSSIELVTAEVHGLRADVHSINGSISKMGTSLETIATTLTKLADLPETWSNVKGFLAVMRWFKENIVLVAATVGVVIYMVKEFT